MSFKFFCFLIRVKASIYYFLLFFSCIIAFNVYGSSIYNRGSSYNNRDLVETILEDSMFNYPLPSLSSDFFSDLIGISTDYDPVLFSILSALSAMTTEVQDIVKKKEWLSVKLPPNKYSVTCPNEIEVLFKPGKSDSSYTYVIMAGAYTPIPWVKGDHINHMVDVLNKGFQEPNIIVFPGVFTRKFLEDSCISIPWDKLSMAKDFYFRIRKFLESISANSNHTGLVGVSLGGAFTVMMMSYDAEAVREESSETVFGLGGFSISPPLHATTTFLNLDNRYDTSINQTDSLTGINIKNFIPKIFNYIWYDFLNEAKDIVAYFQSDRERFIDNVNNEFIVVNLKNILLSIDPDKKINLEEISYYKTFIEEAFINSMNAKPDRLKKLLSSININSPNLFKLSDGRWSLSYQSYNTICDKPTDCIIKLCNQFQHDLFPCPFSIEKLYDKTLDMEAFLLSLETPLFLFTSNDDSVLYPQDEQGYPPAVITDILESADQNENIIIFRPNYGGHCGIFLDPNFEELLVNFFKL